jgi:O-acetylserine/cysteine efflux transporter
VTAVQFLAATLAALPVAAVTEGVPAATGGAGGLLAGAGLTLLGTLAPSTLFAYGQARVAAEVAGPFVNLEPLVGVAAGAVVFGDPVGLAQAGGGAAVLTGIALSSLPLVRAGHPWRRRRRRSSRRRLRSLASAQAYGMVRRSTSAITSTEISPV